MIRYAKPTNVEAALALLAEGPWRILAGGTDFYPALGNRPLSENVLDINGLAELRGISETATHIVIGARTTWTDVIRHDLPAAFDGLKLAAREVGSIQIQNMASVAGNLCNASPAADGVPPLLTLDAEVEIRSAGATRFMPLGCFILGNRRTALLPSELMTALHIPKASAAGSSSFCKLGARRYLVISIAMAAARIVVTNRSVEHATVAVGSCSAVARRLAGIEAALRGVPVTELAEAVAGAPIDELAPIDDVRASADYRREAAREIVTRAVLAAADPTANVPVAA
ncbi:FAD binding domain-containing protein [Pseudaminobacter sp. NGMCC 1.201702]|uniref:FAD binding domain-containing protein n=1 Tax=Pseudaminobacter sp. NGMCC 1.201702 TaxID=3391825 RepID=UPI0039F0F5C7